VCFIDRSLNSKVGNGCKELNSYLNGDKEYIAEARLGIETETQDLFGKPIQYSPYDHVTLQNLKEVLPQFTGEIQQKPPHFSAKKVDGER
jgi:tRNA pseudouridine55 synthase